MPSKHILINNALECFVSDSKMEKLMEYLRREAHDFRRLPIREEGRIKDAATSCIQTLS